MLCDWLAFDTCDLLFPGAVQSSWSSMRTGSSPPGDVTGVRMAEGKHPTAIWDGAAVDFVADEDDEDTSSSTSAGVFRQRFRLLRDRERKREPAHSYACRNRRILRCSQCGVRRAFRATSTNRTTHRVSEPKFQEMQTSHDSSRDTPTVPKSVAEVRRLWEYWQPHHFRQVRCDCLRASFSFANCATFRLVVPHNNCRCTGMCFSHT